MYDQLKHVRSRVVAGRIVLHFACCGQGHVEVGINDGLFVPHRLCHIVSVRVYYAAAASADHVRQPVYLILAVQAGRI